MDDINLLKGFEIEVISNGSGSGTVLHYHYAGNNAVYHKPILGVENEINRINSEIKALSDDFESQINKLVDQSLNKEADILKFHLGIVKGDDFKNRIHTKIQDHIIAAEHAVDLAVKELMDSFNQFEDIVFKEKSKDILDIGYQLKEKLIKKSTTKPEIPKKNIPYIIIVKEFLPSLVLSVIDTNIQGIIVENASLYSHATILAKSFGIPVLRVNELNLLKMSDGDRVLLDTSRGMLKKVDLIKRSKQASLLSENWDKLGSLPFKVWATVAEPSQLNSFIMNQIEGIGLFRTEFMFMRKQDSFPTEKEQIQHYSQLFKNARGKPTIVRTLDIGGDKFLPYFSLGPQDNPNLGLRAHRIYQFHPEIFHTQIRALLIAAKSFRGVLHIMFPMIASYDEYRYVKNLFDQAVLSLQKESQAYCDDFKIGVMIEITSIYWDLDKLFEEIDFASVGTNDLIQYFYARDRNNSLIHNSSYFLNPSIFKLIRDIFIKANNHHIHLNFCGEFLINPNFLYLLVSLGVENISVDLFHISSVIDIMKGVNVDNLRSKFVELDKFYSSDDILKILEDEKLYSKVRNNTHQSQELIDPVCGMLVHRENNPFVIESGGKKVYFCGKKCMHDYLSNEG